MTRSFPPGDPFLPPHPKSFEPSLTPPFPPDLMYLPSCFFFFQDTKSPRRFSSPFYLLGRGSFPPLLEFLVLLLMAFKPLLSSSPPAFHSPNSPPGVGMCFGLGFPPADPLVFFLDFVAVFFGSDSLFRFLVPSSTYPPTPPFCMVLVLERPSIFFIFPMSPFLPGLVGRQTPTPPLSANTFPPGPPAPPPDVFCFEV